MSVSPDSCIHRPRPRRPSTSKTKVNPIDPFTSRTKTRSRSTAAGRGSKRSASGGYPDPWGCCCYLLYFLLAVGLVFLLLSLLFPHWSVLHWFLNPLGFACCPANRTGTGQRQGQDGNSQSTDLNGRSGNSGRGQSQGACGGGSSSSSSSGSSLSRSFVGVNYALCENGAHIFRVNNFPPFRGLECERGSHLILEAGGDSDLDPKIFWQFNPVGDLEISLSEPIVVSGFTLRHPRKGGGGGDVDLNSAPNKIEFNGIEYDAEYREKTTHHFGDFFYTEKEKDEQNFQVLNPSDKKFQIVQLRFHNSQSNGELIHVYKVEIHGAP